MTIVRIAITAVAAIAVDAEADSGPVPAHDRRRGS